MALYRDEEDDDAPPVHLVAFVNVQGKGEPHYRDTVEALSAEDTRAIVLQRAWRDLQAWRKRYQSLKEFAAVVDAADRIGTLFAKRG